MISVMSVTNIMRKILVLILAIFVVVIVTTTNYSDGVNGFTIQSIYNQQSTTTSLRSASSSLFLSKLSSSSSSQLLSNDVYETIQSGNIAIVPNFLNKHEVHLLRSDAQTLWDNKQFSTDALSSYGQNGKFDIRKDRAVLKLNKWKDETLGNYSLRGNDGLGYKMSKLRKDLSYHLDRPNLDKGLSITKYGVGSTEISYTRFGPGAFLKRHVDEHHEELKGVAGWYQPTRRSISWLIYLNDNTWNSNQDGGQLRCFLRKNKTTTNSLKQRLGSQPNGDIQIGWLRSSINDPIERPVFLDGRREEAGTCAMYIIMDDKSQKQPLYITDKFQAHPTLYLGGMAGETLVKNLISQHVSKSQLANRFYFIETPKTLLRDIQMRDYDGSGEPPISNDETVQDVDPIGGTLVLFDSVTLPHEVLATRNNKTRWATSGWFHEDQQPPLLHT